MRRGYADPPSVKVLHQGKDVIALGVSMAKGGDIIRLGKALQAATERMATELPAGVQLANVQDQPRAVATSVNEFVKVLIDALYAGKTSQYIETQVTYEDGRSNKVSAELRLEDAKTFPPQPRKAA